MDFFVEYSGVAIAFLVLLLAVILWPQHGLLWRRLQARGQVHRILVEDALKHLHQCEVRGRPPSVESVAGALHLDLNRAVELLTTMQDHDLLLPENASFRLTPTGREYARHIIRAHRLWERYLADQTGYAETKWHDLAERQEHSLSHDDTNALAAQLGHPTHDAHGDPIPTGQGEIVSHGGKPLTTLEPPQAAQIVHLEDEPPAVYAQLVAEGLQVGMTVRLIEKAPSRLCFWANGDERLLAPIVAQNISVVPLAETEMAEEVPVEHLSDLRPGQKGRVLHISRAVRGLERRRLLDLGMVPGTIVEAELTSPSGDPTAYRIRGALIGLRKEQARRIAIARPEEGTA